MNQARPGFPIFMKGNKKEKERKRDGWIGEGEGKQGGERGTGRGDSVMKEMSMEWNEIREET